MNIFDYFTVTYFVRGNVAVWLTSCLTDLNSAVLKNEINIFNYLTKILTGQTGDWPDSDISPYKVSEHFSILNKQN